MPSTCPPTQQTPPMGTAEAESSPVTPSTEKSNEVAVEDSTQISELKEKPSTTTVVVTRPMRRRGWIQFAAVCWAIYIAGWNDGTVGPLLPRLQEVYHVGYAVVSLLFIANCIGFIVAALAYLYLTERFGFGVIVVISSCLVATGNALQASGSPFPVFVVGCFFVGMGMSGLDAGSNAFVASLNENTSVKMGVMHAIYGVGAMCAPLVSTQFARLPRWSFAYFVHIGLTLVNILVQIAIFRFQSQEGALKSDHENSAAKERMAACLREIGQLPPKKTKESEEGMNKYKQVFRLKAVHLMAFFIFTYVGVEVSISGWIVSYVISQRNGGPNSGYISSGYWGGLTIGRILLLPVNKKIGEWRVIFVYILLVLGLELVVWLVPNLFSGALCISFVGFFLGPMFPIVMNHAGRILPPELISGGIGWIASFGAAGAAIFPFIAGAIASGTSIGSLQPLLISMMGLLLVLWVFVPRERQQPK